MRSAGHRLSEMRGQPIIFLAVVALVWVAYRVAAHISGDAYDGAPIYAEAVPAQKRAGMAPASNIALPAPSPTDAPIKPQAAHRHATFQMWSSALKPHGAVGYGNVAASIAYHGDLQKASTPDQASGTQALPRGILPPAFETETSTAQSFATQVQPAAFPVAPVNTDSSADRWSLQAWGFIRSGSSRAVNIGRGQYGGSQIGLVGRYTLTPRDKRQVQLYARFASALPQQGRRVFEDAELAAGIIGRPVRDIPVALAAEQRIALGRNARTRPTAFAVTQIPPITLPARFTGDIYAQVGAVGLKDTQAFYDLQATAERTVVKRGKAIVSAGAGLWSGGQTGEKTGGQRGDTIARLDIGPRISLRFPVAGGNARLSLDWRQRIAGNAEPGSGVAVTLASDF